MWSQSSARSSRRCSASIRTRLTQRRQQPGRRARRTVGWHQPPAPVRRRVGHRPRHLLAAPVGPAHLALRRDDGNDLDGRARRRHRHRCRLCRWPGGHDHRPLHGPRAGLPLPLDRARLVGRHDAAPHGARCSGRQPVAYHLSDPGHQHLRLAVPRAYRPRPGAQPEGARIRRGGGGYGLRPSADPVHGDAAQPVGADHRLCHSRRYPP